jgi:hypothetical protein
MGWNQKLFDSFTDVLNEPLEAHIPEYGSQWNLGMVGTWLCTGTGEAKVGTGAGDNIVTNLTSFNGNQAAQLIIAHATAALGCGVRITGATPPTLCGYFAVVSATNTIKIKRLDNQVFTDLATLSTSYSVGDKLRLEVTGSKLEAFLNNVSILIFIDNTYSTGSVGMTVTGTNVVASEFSAYEFTSKNPMFTTVGAQ